MTRLLLERSEPALRSPCLKAALLIICVCLRTDQAFTMGTYLKHRQMWHWNLPFAQRQSPSMTVMVNWLMRSLMIQIGNALQQCALFLENLS